MMRTLTPTLGICGLAAAAAVIGFVFDVGSDDAPVGTYGDNASVAIKDFAYSAALVTPGITVDVTNQDGATHTVTSDESGLFTTAKLAGSAKGSFVAPTTPGSYAYHCEIHPSMHGTLVVAST
jgi:plastocyanin